MGALGVLATLAGRRASRLYALALAAVVTLAIDPGVAADVGWQLSFAAVLGILLLAAPLRAAIAARIGARRLAPRARRGRGGDDRRDPGDGAADRLPLRSDSRPRRSLANLLALPAVAPAMWLGMARAAAGPGARLPGRAAQRPRRPAARLHRPGRRLVRPRRAGRARTSSSAAAAWPPPTAMPAAIARGDRACWRGGSRRCARARPAPALAGAGRRRALGRRPWLRCVGAVGGLRLGRLRRRRPGRRRRRPSGLRVEVLDVGQGDAILLAAGRRAGGPGRRRAAGRRARREARRRRASSARRRGGHPRPVRPRRRGRGAARATSRSRASSTRGSAARPLGEARAAGAAPVRVAAGRRAALRAACGCEVLWPPRELLAEPLAGRRPEPARRWSCSPAGATSRCCSPPTPRPRRCRSTPARSTCSRSPTTAATTPGSARCSIAPRPRLAVISVGAGQPLRPSRPPATLATLAAHGVRTLRTDRDGDVVLDVDGHSVEVEPEADRPQRMIESKYWGSRPVALARGRLGRCSNMVHLQARQQLSRLVRRAAGRRRPAWKGCGARRSRCW